MWKVERPAFSSSFEMWREEGVLHLLLTRDARLSLRDMKELLRLVVALDPDGRAPVLVDCSEQVVVEEGARSLLIRACSLPSRSVAFLTTDLEMRLQGELFKRLQRPAFPFRVFGWREDARRWVRERRQLIGLGPLG